MVIEGVFVSLTTGFAVRVGGVVRVGICVGVVVGVTGDPGDVARVGVLDVCS